QSSARRIPRVVADAPAVAQVHGAPGTSPALHPNDVLAARGAVNLFDPGTLSSIQSPARRRMIRSKPAAGSFRIPAYVNVAIIAAQLLALAASFFSAAHVHRWWTLAVLAFAFAILMNSVYSII